MFTFATKFKFYKFDKNVFSNKQVYICALFRSSADLEQQEAGQVTGIGDFFFLEKHSDQ